ncbi:oligopeptide/dipeptide ABC transporter ATP-binding protein [Nonomuraea rubra]|uniref:oligopeptide/dipeptide ABC transporter ATP-binding protein n=1 Tax=Nonomuraea rubra TaxID=46180 RepID=UPI003CD07AE6
MRQRAMIGMGLMGTPRLIIADEPTTALDVTVQQQVLGLLAEVRRDTGAALLLISHDVSVVTDVCDRVLVMYGGRIVEELPAQGLRTLARHPYTRALVAAVPDMETDLTRPLAVIPGLPVDPAHVPAGCAFAARCPLADDHCRSAEPVLEADPAGNRVACHKAGQPLPARTEGGDRMSVLGFHDVRVRYGSHTVLKDVSLEVGDGEIVGLVGESGSGKSTMARAAVGLAPVTGRPDPAGRPAGAGPGPARAPVQMVFQDPYSSLDPRMTAGESIAEALPERTRQAGPPGGDHAPARAGPPGRGPGRRPARAPLRRAASARRAGQGARRPAEVILADEITSALDVSVPGRRAQPRPRHAARPGPVHAVHLPQPGGRPVRRRPRGRDARRGDRRARPHRAGARRAPARVHPPPPRRAPRSGAPDIQRHRHDASHLDPEGADMTSAIDQAHWQSRLDELVRKHGVPRCPAGHTPARRRRRRARHRGDGRAARRHGPAGRHRLGLADRLHLQGVDTRP